MSVLWTKHYSSALGDFSSNLIESAASNFGPDYTVLHERTEVTHSS